MRRRVSARRGESIRCMVTALRDGEGEEMFARPRGEMRVGIERSRVGWEKKDAGGW